LPKGTSVTVGRPGFCRHSPTILVCKCFVCLFGGLVDWFIFFVIITIVDGVWTDWGYWSQCDVSCGTGTRTRTRSCTNPPPSHGGDDCQGTSQETSTCTMTHCPGKGLLNSSVELLHFFDTLSLNI